jgi:hypothetical protein
MLRRISLFAVSAALAVAFLGPSSASAEVNSCPSGWDRIPFDLVPGYEDTDRNGDGFICHHEAHIGIGSVFTDNHIPH